MVVVNRRHTLKHPPRMSCTIPVTLVCQYRYVAFIVAGCTHTTYYKTLKHALGIDAVQWTTFQSIIKRMFPVVQEMVDRMCEEAKTEMKTMNQDELGSWNRAVTSADGAWMTRGHHSKNFTFSIRNYYTGALLYRKHLCQKGRDTLINEELYPGTSKGAEGYAARLTFKKAKEEGINIAIHWQDADSSSSNAMTEHFPDAEVMICGGHAGKAHKKQLEELAKKKSFTDKYKKKHREKFPQVDSVVCHCEKRHTPGCGCLSAAFIEKERNNFSFILSNSESAHDFAEALKVLPRHACDEHKWDGGKCTFHELKVCSCGKCEDDADLKCDGKDYHTRQILKCPMHSLAYEIECHRRASMSEQLVHPILKRGHSNWLEASHNVFIRFRPKHIHLERLHYILSTELALLQSNMTYMYGKRGSQYHWVVELFRRLKLPVYDGVHRALEDFNKLRMDKLEHEKTEKSKKRRIMLKVERTKDAQRRKEWSRKHGHDTYGDDEDSDTAELKPKKEKKTNKGQKKVEGQCKCGSKTHLRTSHNECPYNKKRVRANDAPTLPHKDDDASQPHSDLSDDDMSLAGDNNSSDESESTGTSSDDWCYEDDIISSEMCVCGALGRAHKRYCPMSSRSNLLTEVYSTDSRLNQSDSLWGTVDKSKSNLSTSGKRKSQEVDKHPIKKKRVTTSFEIGNYVCLHSSRLVGQHVPCRIVRKCRKGYQLYCRKGILDRTYSSGELTNLDDKSCITLDVWRQASRISFKSVIDDPTCMQTCNCVLSKSAENFIELTNSTSSDETSAGVTMWVHNAVYFLTNNDKELILSPSGWLNDSIISAAQKLMLQHFPLMSGLQPPTLQHAWGFDVHRGDFVQILHVHNSHWSVVSNIGCEDGVVNYYDSMYPSVSSATMQLIATLVFSPVSELEVRIMDVGQQSNGSDCGVLAIAFAFDICCGKDPCSVRFDHKSIRHHLAKCLEDCQFTRFPILGERNSSGIKHTQKTELHCSCRLPEKVDDKMAECEACKVWYHQHCMDIPNEVFDSSDVPWRCKECKVYDAL